MCRKGCSFHQTWSAPWNRTHVEEPAHDVPQSPPKKTCYTCAINETISKSNHYAMHTQKGFLHCRQLWEAMWHILLVSFPTEGFYTEHIETHTNTQNPQYLASCGKAFPGDNVTISPIQPFLCPYCISRFSAASVYSHTMLHRINKNRKLSVMGFYLQAVCCCHDGSAVQLHSSWNDAPLNLNYLTENTPLYSWFSKHATKHVPQLHPPLVFKIATLKCIRDDHLFLIKMYNFIWFYQNG